MSSVEDQSPGSRVAEVLAGGGKMGALMRAFDWAATPLGPVEGWSQSLCTMVKILLANRFPLLLWWGSEQCQLYNDAYRPVLGAKHPRSLGQPARQCWPEIWPIIGPLIQTPYEGGPATWDDDLFLELNRHGFVEETHFTVAYSPVPDESAPGGIGGVLATVHEITQQVVQERRLAVLRDLGAGASDAKTAEEACAIAAAVLEQHPKDVPFALLYLLEDDQRIARLAAAAGVPGGTASGQALVDLTAEDERPPWPLAAVLRSDQAQVVTPLRNRIDIVPPGPWSDPPERALVLPVPSTVAHRPAGLLVLGLSARLALDDQYRSFGALVAGQIGTAIANARAYEEERRRVEALAELDRAKTAFFSNVSHEFRTPLTLLLGPLEEALAAPPETPLAAERAQLESAHRNSLRLLRLVNTLLDFSRIEAGRAEVSYEPTDLAAYTAELAGVFRSAVERAGLRLAVDCPPLPEPVYVDRDMWEKIVLNLLSNAFKFTFAGEIAVVLRATGAHVTLAVRDTGTGIPAEELPHLFERFHRVRGARARTHEGTGIGLALVRELVALHDGAIEVDSAPHRGTTFTVTLPLGTTHLPAARIGAARALASTALDAAPYVEEALRWLPESDAPITAAEPATEEVTTSTAETQAAPRTRVLLADDNADMRAYVRRLLGARYTVEAVADGAAALAAAQECPPDLVVADVMMPGLDGFALLRALRADPRTRTLPVILLSARAGEEATAAGLRAGADDYLVKPFVASELLARVQAHVALARLRQAAREEVVAERDRLQAEVTARARAEEALQRSHEHLRQVLSQLQTLQAISDAAFSQLTLPALLREVLAHVTGALTVDNTAILLLDESGRMLTVHMAHGPEEVQTGQMRIPVGQGVAGRIAATRQPLILYDLQQNPPVNPLLREQMASLLGVPLLVEGRLIGVMHVDSATPRQFTDDDLHLLQLVADRVALALDNARLYRQALEARADAEAGRRRTVELARQVGDELAFSRALTDSIADGVYAVDRSGCVTFMNPSAEALLGWRLDELRGRDMHQAIHFQYADGTPLPEEDCPLLDVIRSGEVVRRDEDVFTRRDGSTLPVSYASAPIVTDGTITGAVVTFQDRTERQHMEEERARLLAAAEAERDRLQQVINALPAAVVLADASGRFTMSNETAAAMFGVGLPGRNVPHEEMEAYESYGARRLDGTVYPSDELPLQRAMWQGEVVRGEQFLTRTPGGREIPVLANTAPLLDAEGAIVGAVGVFQDITAIRELERAREEFLSSAAHDLKTPLTSIRGQAQLAQRRLARLDNPQTAPVLGQLTRIQEGTDAMLSLINELVDVTRQQMGGGLELHREPTDLVALVQNCIEIHRDESGHPIHLEVAVPDLYATVDAARLARVVGNLLSNALKYSPAESPIWVGLRREDGAAGPEAVLTVRDEGIGIPAADVPHIFDRFARAGNVVGHIQGTGIGLASARSIVEQHGGAIAVQSAEGKGSAFTVRLPLAAP